VAASQGAVGATEDDLPPIASNLDIGDPDVIPEGVWPYRYNRSGYEPGGDLEWVFDAHGYLPSAGLGHRWGMCSVK
jgi:hypothetical protein